MHSSGYAGADDRPAVVACGRLKPFSPQPGFATLSLRQGAERWVRFGIATCASKVRPTVRDLLAKMIGAASRQVTCKTEAPAHWRNSSSCRCQCATCRFGGGGSTRTPGPLRPITSPQWWTASGASACPTRCMVLRFRARSRSIPATCASPCSFAVSTAAAARCSSWSPRRHCGETRPSTPRKA